MANQENYYREALKQGQREFRACTGKGAYPYLPALGEFLTSDQMTDTMELGTVLVPLAHVVGTRLEGRTKAFARNFMPLMGEETEFATKWNNLCRVHLEEGIRDPVKVWEYMNRFYVEEGNKRVSVLKFFGAPNIYAQVTRILPRRNGSREVELYYEFVDFYQYSQISFVELSRPGGYVQLQNLVGKGPKEKWTAEERSRFTTAFYYFEQAYQASGGDQLSTTVGDALLAYLRIYGYGSLRGKTEGQIRDQVSRVWEEITLQEERSPIDVKLDRPEPEEKRNVSILSRVFSGGRGEDKPLRAAFLNDRTPETSDWTYGHERGRIHLERRFGGKVITTAYHNALEGDPLEVIERAVEEGNRVIFTTSPRLLSASLRGAVDHPEVTILNCSLNTSHRYIRTYYARMYEVKFISGAIAGALAGADPVGYLCDYPIYGQVAGINAFALGVQLTNPRTRVFLDWSSVGGAKEATQRLLSQGIRLISAQDQSRRTVLDRHFGLSLINEDGSQVNLARPVWQWGVYYGALLNHIQERSFHREYAASRKALNYYWGMAEGVVDLRCSFTLPDSTRRLARMLRDSVCNRSCVPFRGPLYDQSGQQRLGEGEALDTQAIINMDWLVENVVGGLPRYDELTEVGKATVGVVGVKGPQAIP